MLTLKTVKYKQIKHSKVKNKQSILSTAFWLRLTQKMKFIKTLVSFRFRCIDLVKSLPYYN